MLDLGEIREKIDGIDKQLVSLFEERMALCHSVAVSYTHLTLPTIDDV